MVYSFYDSEVEGRPGLGNFVIMDHIMRARDAEGDSAAQAMAMDLCRIHHSMLLSGTKPGRVPGAARDIIESQQNSGRVLKKPDSPGKVKVTGVES